MGGLGAGEALVVEATGQLSIAPCQGSLEHNVAGPPRRAAVGGGRGRRKRRQSGRRGGQVVGEGEQGWRKEGSRVGKRMGGWVDGQAGGLVTW